MQILFLDTETTGVNFNEDQIIEIAALVVDFDLNTLKFTEVSSFEKLVKLRQRLDDKITRITGITDLDLGTASPIHTVQEDWMKWIESNENIEMVVGHSIDFDLKFIKKESWFLPDSIIVCDTLELSKIFLPQYSAVNLEFLKDKLDLKPQVQTDESKNLSHRALFDAKICYLLFKNLISRLDNLDLPQAFLAKFKELVLPINLEKYSKVVEKPTVNLTLKTGKLNPDELVYIDFFGNSIEPSLGAKLNNLDPGGSKELLIKLINTGLPKDFTIILLQLYIICEIKESDIHTQLKLHGQGKVGFCFAELFINLANPDKEGGAHNPGQHIISPFENIISQIKSLAEINHDLAKTINLLEVYLHIKLYRQKLDKSTITVEKWLGAYEFLLISLSPFWRNNEFKYFKHLLNHETNIISKKFGNLCEMNNELKATKLDESDELMAILSNKINEVIAGVHIDPRKDFTFRFFNNSLSIGSPKTDFDLVTHFEKLFSKITDLEVETYLSSDSFTKFLSMIGVDSLFEKYSLNITYLSEGTEIDEAALSDSTDNSNSDQISLEVFLRNLLIKANQSKKAIIMLGGQNSSLKDIQKILVDSFDVKEYLVLGESGSLTKLGSKIEKGFVGLVATKVGDVYYLLRQKNIPQFEEIWIVNQPYLWIHPYWFSFSKNQEGQEEFLMKVKRIYLEFQLNQINILSKSKVGFLKSYKL